jgi:hypothetical protein
MQKKVLAPFVPAVAIVIWLIVDRIWLSQFTEGMAYWVLLDLGVPFLIGAIMAFVTTLILPIATTRQLSIRYAIPSAFAYLVFFLVNAVVMTILDPSFRSLENIGFDIIICFGFYIPIGLLLLINVAFCGWIGTRMRLVNQSKFRSSNNTSMDPKKP